MRLKVHCEQWVLGDRGRGVAVGDSFSEWLVLHDEDEEGWPTALRMSYEVVVTPLPSWEGLGVNHHAYRVQMGSAVAYWESPRRYDAGPMTVTGVWGLDTYRAPPDWPTTTGTVVRMWTEHRWYVLQEEGGTWVFQSPAARYEEVPRCGWIDEGSPERGEGPREAWTGVLLEVDINADEPSRAS